MLRTGWWQECPTWGAAASDQLVAWGTASYDLTWDVQGGGSDDKGGAGFVQSCLFHSCCCERKILSTGKVLVLLKWASES